MTNGSTDKGGTGANDRHSAAGTGHRKKGGEARFLRELYPAGTSEADLADAVERFPELQPRLVAIAEKISYLILYTCDSIWFGPEEQAGSLITRALALYDKQYCALFARLLEDQDLLHEVHQNEYIDDILRKWGLCEETALIIDVRRDCPGQEGEQYLEELQEEYGEELDRYLDNIAYDDEDDEDDDEEDAQLEGGYTVHIQSKRNSRFLTLQWDEDGDVLVVNYFILKPRENRIWAMQYPSPQALLQEVAELRQQCVPPRYTWEQETDAPHVQTVLQYGGVSPEPPFNLMELFSANT